MNKKIDILAWYKTVMFAVSNVMKIKKTYCFLYGGFALINTILPFFDVFMIKKIIFYMTEVKNFDNAFKFAIIMFTGNLLLKELQIFISWRENISYMEILDEIAVINGKKVMEIDYGCLEDADSLDKMSNIYQTQHVTGKVIQNLCSLICACIGLIGSAAVIATLNPLFLIILTLFVFITAYSNSIAMRKTNRINLESALERRKGEYLEKITLDSGVGKEIRIFTAYNYFTQKIKQNNIKKLAFEAIKSRIMINTSIITVIVNAVQTIGMYAYMSYRYILGAISISDFSMYLGMVSNFSKCIFDISTSFFNIFDQYEMLEKYEEYHKLPQTLRTSSKRDMKVPDKAAVIEFKNVWFKYPGADNYSLERINFVMNKGETISVIGENGAGKTTLIKLLCRLYDPTIGDIFLNGINIKEFPYDDYMQFISTVFQDYKLFAFTIKENMDCEGEKCNEDIIKALKEVGVFDKVDSLKEGLYSHLYKGKGWDGYELSGGENQKLAIARAYLKESSLVILDEPTAAIDPLAEYNIYKCFHELVKGKNAIYISHRMSSAKFSDRILFISNKTITESGSHEELMLLQGAYSRMYEMQARYYK